MWWSIEVLDAAFPASLWQDAHGSFLIEAALTRRGRNWRWHRHAWGVVFEVEFDDEDTWETFRRLPAVQAALDAVPDPIEGLLIYPGRGGSSGRVAPRRTSPTSGAGAAALPIPPEEILPEPAPDPRSTTADLAPFLLGEGGRLFEDLPPDHVELELVRVLERRTTARRAGAAGQRPAAV